MYVLDNYDAYRDHEARQEAELKRLPKCEHCGERIQDDFLYEIDGGLYCESCMNDLFRHSTEDYER